MNLIRQPTIQIMENTFSNLRKEYSCSNQQEAYEVLKYLFNDVAGPQFWLHKIKLIQEGVFGMNASFENTPPDSMIHSGQLFLKLIYASAHFQHSPPIPNSELDWKHMICPWHERRVKKNQETPIFSQLLDFCPKHLTMEETLDPSAFIRDFFSVSTIQEWVDRWNQLREYAFYQYSMMDGDEGSYLFDFQFLLKLTEASYLLFLRHGRSNSIKSNEINPEPTSTPVSMKTKTKSTTPSPAETFRMFLQALVEKFSPIQIISFGTQTIDNTLEGCFANSQQKKIHQCLLLIMESPTRIDYEVQEFVNNHYPLGQLTIICHGEASIKEAIHANSRFFITTINQGKTLYTQSGFHLIDDAPTYIPTKAKAKAENHVFHRTPLIEGFLEAANDALQKERYNLSLFLMHQTVEQSCILLIRVHIAYRSEFHNLNRLLGLCRCFSDEPQSLLIGSDSKDRKLFDLLIKSYAKARYASSFSVNPKDAQELYSKISAFVDLTKKMCSAKLEELGDLTLSTEPVTKNQ